MSWIIYTLLAAFIWALVNIIDKYTLSKLINSPIVPITMLGLVGILTASTVFITDHYEPMFFQQKFLAMSAGSLYLLVMYFYYQAIKIEEVSKVIPLYYLAPIFTLLGSWILLSELITIKQAVAVILIVFGAIFLSIKKGSFWGHNKAAIYMLCAAITYSANQIITKYLLETNDFWSVFSYGRLGLFFTLIPILLFNFTLLMNQFRVLSCKSIALITINQVLNVTGIFLITIALSKGYVGLVNGLAAIQPLFVLIMASLLSFLFPHIIKENIKFRELNRKILAIFIILTGALLIG